MTATMGPADLDRTPAVDPVLNEVRATVRTLRTLLVSAAILVLVLVAAVVSLATRRQPHPEAEPRSSLAEAQAVCQSGMLDAKAALIVDVNPDTAEQLACLVGRLGISSGRQVMLDQAVRRVAEDGATATISWGLYSAHVSPYGGSVRVRVIEI